MRHVARAALASALGVAACSGPPTGEAPPVPQGASSTPPAATAVAATAPRPAAAAAPAVPGAGDGAALPAGARGPATDPGTDPAAALELPEIPAPTLHALLGIPLGDPDPGVSWDDDAATAGPVAAMAAISEPIPWDALPAGAYGNPAYGRDGPLDAAYAMYDPGPADPSGGAAGTALLEDGAWPGESYEVVSEIVYDDPIPVMEHAPPSVILIGGPVLWLDGRRGGCRGRVVAVPCAPEFDPHRDRCLDGPRPGVPSAFDPCWDPCRDPEWREGRTPRPGGDPAVPVASAPRRRGPRAPDPATSPPPGPPVPPVADGAGPPPARTPSAGGPGSPAPRPFARGPVQRSGVRTLVPGASGSPDPASLGAEPRPTPPPRGVGVRAEMAGVANGLAAVAPPPASGHGDPPAAGTVARRRDGGGVRAARAAAAEAAAAAAAEARGAAAGETGARRREREREPAPPPPARPAEDRHPRARHGAPAAPAPDRRDDDGARRDPAPRAEPPRRADPPRRDPDPTPPPRAGGRERPARTEEPPPPPPPPPPRKRNR